MVGTIRVEIRKNVSGKSGKNPISLIYSISGIRKRYALNKLVFPEYWDAKSQRANYILQREAKKLLPHLSVNDLLTETEINDINNEIQSVSTRIEKIEDKFLANEKPFSSQMVIDELKAIDAVSPKTKKEEQTGLVFDFIDSYVNENEATREKGSLSVYKSVKNHLQAYQDTTGHKVTFEKIDYSFFQKFQTFLIQRIKVNKAGEVSPMLNNTTIAKALSTLKTFLGYARKHGIKVNDSYRDFTIKREKLEVIALTQEEFDSLLNEDLSANKRLEKVRDIFCFACATGLRYSDIAQLKREHIADNLIKLTIKKTKTELTIPLNSISASILEKYNDLNKPLPLISNQNLNYYIKELCEKAKINQPIEIVRFYGKKREVNTYAKHDLIHFHTARKTFVTLSLEKGMSAEEVMTISGHEDYKSFSRYVKVTENRKKVVMLKAWGEPIILKVVK